MPNWLLPGIGLIVANILVWAFVWGRRTGRVNQRLMSLEKWFEAPTILPECSGIFTEIKEGLAKVQGKVSTVLLIMTENQKSSERKRISKKRRKEGL